MRQFSFKYLPCILVLLSLTGCEQHFFQKWTDIAYLNWTADNVVSNQIEITETEATYQISIGLRYLHDISQKGIKVALEISSPSQKTSTKEYEIMLKDENGDDIGEVMAELVDIIQIVENDFKFEEKGSYTFKIKQLTGDTELGGIVEVGLIVDKK